MGRVCRCVGSGHLGRELNPVRVSGATCALAGRPAKCPDRKQRPGVVGATRRSFPWRHRFQWHVTENQPPISLGSGGGHVDLRPLRSRGVSVFSAGLSRLSAALHPHHSFTHELALGPAHPRRLGWWPEASPAACWVWTDSHLIAQRSPLLLRA